MSELSLGQIKGLSVNDNKVTVPAGHTLYAPGHVIQTVSVTKTDTFTASVTAGGEAEITGLTATITPKFTTSKILVLASVSLGSIADQNGVYVSLFRATTPVGQGDGSGNRQTVTAAAYGVPASAAGTEAMQTIPINFLDSPATIGSTTYSIKMSHARGATQTMYVNRALADTDYSYEARSISTITLMEIAA